MFGDIALITKGFFILSKELNWLFFRLPNVKKPTEIKIKKKQTAICFLPCLKINTAGAEKIEIQTKLKE